MARSLRAKLISETITVKFDFTGQLEFGETISGQSVSVEVWSGLDFDPSALLDNTPSHSGSVVSVDITAGLAGVIYNLIATATGSSGNVYQLTKRLAVLSNTSSFAPSDTPALLGTLPDATVGVPYSENLTIVGGYPPYEFDDIISGVAPPWMSFNISGNLLVCAGPPDETVSTVYTFTPQIRDAVNNLASDPQVMNSLHMVLSGDLGDGAVGDAVSGTYSQTGGVEPVTYSVFSGTFPAGVTLNSDGTYSGSFTTFAQNSWVIKGVDAVGTVAYLNDSNVVGKYLWWMTASGSSVAAQRTYLWTTIDFSSWDGPVVRSPNTDPYYGPAYANDNMMVFAAGTPAELVTIANPTNPTPTTLTTVPGLSNIRFVRTFPGVIFTSDQTGPYYLSIDSGVSWTQYPSPSGTPSLDTLDLCQLGIRWITVTYGAPRKAYYSDLPIPNGGWTFGDTVGSGECLISSGSAVVLWNNGTSHDRTTDGVNWNTITTTFSASGRCGAYGNGIMIASGSNGKVARSFNDGATWTEVALPAGGTVSTISYNRGIWAVTNAGTLVGDYLHISTDDGASWQTVTLPFAQNSTNGSPRVALNYNIVNP